MTANVTKLEENKVRLDVEVPPDAVRKGVEAKVRELGRQVRVPGFRPGKAPRRVIENRLGRDYIMMEALQKALPSWYSEAVVETDLSLIGVGTPFNGSEIDLTYIKQASSQIGQALRGKDTYHLVVVKSTVVPGTTDEVVLPIFEERSGS